MCAIAIASLLPGMVGEFSARNGVTIWKTEIVFEMDPEVGTPGSDA